MDTIKVFVIDNSDVFLEGIGNAINETEDIRMIGRSEINETITELVEAYNPNVLLLDIGLPLLTGLDLARRIKRILPMIPLVILASHYDDGHLFQAIKSGACGYLLKETTPDELFQTIRRIHQGKYMLIDAVMSQPAVMEKILRQFQDISLDGPAMERLVSPLSSRQLEILNHKARGLLNKQVAHMLDITEQSIKNHMASILRKLEINDWTQAVITGMRHSWFSQPA